MAYQIIMPHMINNTAAADNLISLKHRTRKINNETIMQFQLLLKNETWETVYKDSDTNNKFNSFLFTFLDIFEASFPTFLNIFEASFQIK
jgi:hypothetical protein